jgi:hypothetical protein
METTSTQLQDCCLSVQNKLNQHISTGPCEWEWAVAHRGSTAEQRWIPYNDHTQMLIAAAERSAGHGDKTHLKIRTEIFRWNYEINLEDFVQRNLDTGRERSIRKTNRPLLTVEGGERDFDDGEEINITVMTMNGDCFPVTTKSKTAVMSLKRSISEISGASAYEMSLYLQNEQDGPSQDVVQEQNQNQEQEQEQEQEQKPLSNRRRLHEFDDPVQNGSVLLLVVGQRAGIGDILCDIENFNTEGSLKSFREQADVAGARRRRLAGQHRAADGRIFPVMPLAQALQDAFMGLQGREPARARGE